MNFFKRIRFNSPVVLSFAILSFSALILDEVTNGWTTINLFCVYRSSFKEPLTYVRLFLHIFGHASLSHYVNNMLLLLILGPILEEKYGSKILLQIIAITAVITGLIHMFLSDTALLGASGVVFMMIILSSMVNLKNGQIPLTAVVVILIYLGQEVYNGIYLKDNVSRLTHIIGGLCGVFFGIFLSHTPRRHKKA